MKQTKKQQELEERYRKLRKENQRFIQLNVNFLISVHYLGEEFEPTKEERESMANALKEHKAKYGTEVARMDTFLEEYLSEHPQIEEEWLIDLEKRNAWYRYKILSRYQTPSLQNEQLIFLQKMEEVDEYYMVTDLGELSIESKRLEDKYAENVEKYGSWETYVQQCHTSWRLYYVIENLQKPKINANIVAFNRPDTYEKRLINLVKQLDEVCKQHIHKTITEIEIAGYDKFDKGSQSGDYNIDILCELWNKIQDVGEQLVVRNNLMEFNDNPFERCADEIQDKKFVWSRRLDK